MAEEDILMKPIRPEQIDYDKLFQLVEKYPVIYDVKHPKYNHKIECANAWKEISTKFKDQSMFYFVLF